MVLFIPTMMVSQSKDLISQKYSGKGIQLIAPGLISSQMGEYSPFFDVNSNELYFMRRTPGRFDYTIYVSKLTNKGWSKPKIASFSGKYRDAAPYLSPDGKTFVFDSRRPSKEVVPNSINIWITQRKDSNWEEPELLREASINKESEPETGVDEYGPAIDSNGIIYFYSFRQPYRGGAHYKLNPSAVPTLSLHTELPDPSYRTFVSYSYISPNGRFALLEGKDRSGRGTDIFYTCKNSEDKWYKAKRVDAINTGSGEGLPSLTADGNFLLFTSGRNTNSNMASGDNLYIIETKDLFGKCQKVLHD